MTATKLKTIQTDPEIVPPIMAWNAIAALRETKDGKEVEKDQVKIKTLKVGDGTIAKELGMLYTNRMTHL